MGIEDVTDDQIWEYFACYEQVSFAAVAGPDGEMTAASGNADDYWTPVWCQGPYEAVIGDETHSIIEGQILADALENRFAPNGVFLGGERYKFTWCKDIPSPAGTMFRVIAGAKTGAGMYGVKFGDGNILVSIWTEDAGQDQGPSLDGTLYFADQLVSDFSFEAPSE